MAYPPEDGHPSQYSVTSLMQPTMLPLYQRPSKTFGKHFGANLSVVRMIQSVDFTNISAMHREVLLQIGFMLYAINCCILLLL